MKWKFTCTDDALPEDRQSVLWWHPKTEDWRLGPYYVQEGAFSPGYFWGDGAWYVCDGPTFWIPEPPPPQACITIAAPDQTSSRPKSVECGNCGIYRVVDDQWYVEECPNCGDDEWNIIEAEMAEVP